MPLSALCLSCRMQPTKILESKAPSTIVIIKSCILQGSYRSFLASLWKKTTAIKATYFVLCLPHFLTADFHYEIFNL